MDVEFHDFFRFFDFHVDADMQTLFRCVAISILKANLSHRVAISNLLVSYR